MKSDFIQIIVHINSRQTINQVMINPSGDSNTHDGREESSTHKQAPGVENKLTIKHNKHFLNLEVTIKHFIK